MSTASKIERTVTTDSLELGIELAWTQACVNPGDNRGVCIVGGCVPVADPGGDGVRIEEYICDYHLGFWSPDWGTVNDIWSAFCAWSAATSTPPREWSEMPQREAVTA